MRKKTTGQPNNNPGMNVIVRSSDVKTLVTSSEIININNEEKVFYLSVPFDNDWEKLKIKGPVKFVSRNFVNHYCVPIKHRPLLESIASQIKSLFKSNQSFLGKLSKNPDELWHINVTYPTRIRTLKVDKIEKPNEVSGQLDKYLANSFANEQDAVDMLNKIMSILGI